MNNNKTVRIFMMPQNFPCGPKSTCCGPIGQSKGQIEDLQSSIKKELGYEVEILDVTNYDSIKNFEQVVQLLSNCGPGGLPILTLEEDIVSMGSSSPDEVVAVIREKVSQL